VRQYWRRGRQRDAGESQPPGGEQTQIGISSVFGCVQAQNLAEGKPASGRCQTVCKPGSVPPESGDGHSSGASVAERLARPTRAAVRRPARRHRHSRFRLPLLLGLAPGGVCPAAPVAGGAVRSYRTISPLPPMKSHNGIAGSAVCFCGTFPRVAPAGRYPAPRLRGARTFLPPPRPRAEQGAAIRPSGRGSYGTAAAADQTATGESRASATKRRAGAELSPRR
jgi:hypothetical protein